MSNETFTYLKNRAKDVVNKLDWNIYHTPENLTLFLLGEATEVGEYCQWLTKTQIKDIYYDHLCEEIADVIKNVLYFSNALNLNISLETLILNKLKLDSIEYPISEYKDVPRYLVQEVERRKKPISPLPINNLNKIVTINDLQGKSWEFVEERNWQKFYTPTSLSLAIAIKCGEVATCYQRRPKPIKNPYERLVWALSDILINVMRLSKHLDIRNLFEIVQNKINEDEDRFQQINRTD